MQRQCGQRDTAQTVPKHDRSGGFSPCAGKKDVIGRQNVYHLFTRVQSDIGNARDAERQYGQNGVPDAVGHTDCCLFPMGTDRPMGSQPSQTENISISTMASQNAGVLEMSRQ